jgi:NAD(P)-dependent dehydrogenase (short-subunit alcohol dehydrogenase family)
VLPVVPAGPAAIIVAGGVAFQDRGSLLNARTIVVTGCSSGIGDYCAKALRERGWRVIATARKDADLSRLSREGLEAVRLDYAETDSVEACAREVERLTGGRLEALFNNGAYGQVGAVEDLSRDVLRRQFEANLFGWHDLTRRLIPMMRQNGGGRIVQCSSVLGFVGMKWRGAYVSSKFALEGLSDVMRLELAPSNIKVILIEPGPIASRFTQNALANFELTVDEAGSPYAADYQRQRARLGRGGSARFKLGPEAVFDRLVHALERPRPAVRYRVTVPTLVMAALKRVLTDRQMDAVLDRGSDQ